MRRRNTILISAQAYFKPVAVYMLSLFFCLTLNAQYNAVLKVNVPSIHSNDTVYVAGNFNGWDPGRAGYAFTKNDSVHTYQLSNQPAGIYEFKFTRGSWDKGEMQANGGGVDNHILKLVSDTMMEYRVQAWADDVAPAAPRQHTASKNVRIIDTAFNFPLLNRKRRIWVYLPPGYNSGKKRYPVMYMHDGQNLFDEYTAAFGEWGVDKCLDSLIEKGSPACIVVGIDNGPQRMTEYNPFDFDKFGKGEGDLYLQSIIKTLKPYIDKHYRTLKNNENTIIAGSSMGGLISYYALLKYPTVFSKAGVFSPAFWTADGIQQLTDSLGDRQTGKFFFYVGELEGERYVKDMANVVESLGKSSSAFVYSAVDPEASHNEAAWRKWFPAFYKWIMADGYNNVIKLED